jgi:hypothetical protein
MTDIEFKKKTGSSDYIYIISKSKQNHFLALLKENEKKKGI